MSSISDIYSLPVFTGEPINEFEYLAEKVRVRVKSRKRRRHWLRQIRCARCAAFFQSRSELFDTVTGLGAGLVLFGVARCLMRRLIDESEESEVESPAL